jgi:hypothetical protein
MVDNNNQEVDRIQDGLRVDQYGVRGQDVPSDISNP